MFAKIAAFAAFALPLVSALTINTPTGVTTGGLVNVTWEATTADPGTFSIYMQNAIFHNTFAIANNVQTSAGILTITLPQVPVSDGYTLQAISITNVNTVYSTSGDFAVGAQTTASLSSMSTTSMTSSTGTPGTASTVAPATTAAATTAKTSSSASATPSNINSSGAASLKNSMGPAAVVLLSAVAGAIML